jgi:AcrR family transcriptional regulator
MECERSDRTVTTTRSRRRERTRAAILESARELVLEQGAERLSLRKVAARADYSPAALYRYFRDKEELVGAAAEEALRALADYFAEVPSELPPGERIIALGLRYLDFARDEPELFTLIFTRLPIQFATWDEFVEHAWPFSVLLDEVRKGVRAGELQVGLGRGAAELAYGCWAFVHGLAMLRLTRMRGVETDFDALHRVLVRAWVRSLRPGRRGQRP